MKKYLTIVASLLMVLSASAMAPKASQAALNAPTNETETMAAPSEEDASAANNTTPIPPLVTEEKTEDSFDRATGKRGAIERRMTEKDISTKRKASSVSGTVTPRY